MVVISALGWQSTKTVNKTVLPQRLNQGTLCFIYNTCFEKMLHSINNQHIASIDVSTSTGQYKCSISTLQVCLKAKLGWAFRNSQLWAFLTWTDLPPHPSLSLQAILHVQRCLQPLSDGSCRSHFAGNRWMPVIWAWYLLIGYLQSEGISVKLQIKVVWHLFPLIVVLRGHVGKLQLTAVC